MSERAKENYRCRQCRNWFSIELPNTVFCSKCKRKLANPVRYSKAGEHFPRFLKVGGIIFAVLVFLVGLNVLVEFVSPTQKQPQNEAPPVTSTFQPEAKPAPASYSDVKYIDGKVVLVLDGDTIIVLDSDNKQFTVQLEAIDAPELKQEFGNEAKRNLAELLDGQAVRVIYTKISKHGLVTGKVLIDSEDVNLQQIKDGFAWHYTAQTVQSENELRIYSNAQSAAQYSETGLWATSDPTPPWEFRKLTAVNSDFDDKILGDKTSLIYFWKGCKDFSKISKKNRVVFAHTDEAKAAGYRAAQDCSTPAPVPETQLDEDYDQPLDLEANKYEPVPLATPQIIYEERVETNPTPFSVGMPSPTPSYLENERMPSVTENRLPTALCNDGTYSYSLNNQGTCSNHGGVARWLDRTTSESIDQNYPTTNQSSDSSVSVRGYYRRDGTYVAPYWRSKADGTTSNNWSTRGNINPYTGKRGTRRP